MKISNSLVSFSHFFVLAFLFFLPSLGFAQETIATTRVDFKHHFLINGGKF